MTEPTAGVLLWATWGLYHPVEADELAYDNLHRPVSNLQFSSADVNDVLTAPKSSVGLVRRQLWYSPYKRPSRAVFGGQPTGTTCAASSSGPETSA